MSNMQEPTLRGVRIRSTRDAHQIFYAVARKLLPMTVRRLDAEERRAIESGNVYVWEERGANSEATGVGIERWTDGMHWSPSRVRDEFLFYHQKETKPDILSDPSATRWARMVKPRTADSPTSTSVSSLPSGVPHVRPSHDPEKLIKQTYSVHVTLPQDSSSGIVRKWHLTAYFTQATVDSLDTVEAKLGSGIMSSVPDGWFRSARTGKVRRENAQQRKISFAQQYFPAEIATPQTPPSSSPRPQFITQIVPSHAQGQPPVLMQMQAQAQQVMNDEFASRQRSVSFDQHAQQFSPPPSPAPSASGLPTASPLTATSTSTAVSAGASGSAMNTFYFSPYQQSGPSSASAMAGTKRRRDSTPETVVASAGPSGEPAKGFEVFKNSSEKDYAQRMSPTTGQGQPVALYSSLVSATPYPSSSPTQSVPCQSPTSRSPHSTHPHSVPLTHQKPQPPQLTLQVPPLPPPSAPLPVTVPVPVSAPSAPKANGKAPMYAPFQMHMNLPPPPSTLPMSGELRRDVMEGWTGAGSPPPDSSGSSRGKAFQQSQRGSGRDQAAYSPTMSAPPSKRTAYGHGQNQPLISIPLPPPPSPFVQSPYSQMPADTGPLPSVSTVHPHYPSMPPQQTSLPPRYSGPSASSAPSSSKGTHPMASSRSLIPLDRLMGAVTPRRTQTDDLVLRQLSMGSKF